MQTYSVKEIAKMLNTNPETVRRWIRSGKLEATQESRKSGNVVTEEKLNSFLKSSPKYAGTMVAAGLLAPLGGITAVAVSSFMAQHLLKKEDSKDSLIAPEELKNFFNTQVQLCEEKIKKAEDEITQLQAEIASQYQQIAEFKQNIRVLELQCDETYEERRDVRED